MIEYALAHPRDGYRRWAWRMVDEDVAYVSPFSTDLPSYRLVDTEAVYLRRCFGAKGGRGRSGSLRSAVS